MKVPTVEKFFCCIKLEIGALILGWFGLLWSFVAILFLSVIFVWSIFSYSSMINILPSDQYITELLKTYSPILIKFLVVIMITYFGAYFYSCKRLVGCLKSRDPVDTVPYICIIIFNFLFSLLSAFHFTWAALIQTIIGVLWYGYIFICIYSFKKLLHEEARISYHRNSKYQSAPLTMYNF